MPPSRFPAYGKGKAHVNSHGRNEAYFSILSYQYPLKLLSPVSHAEIPLATAYILSYGGGLVSGDRIELNVQVGKGCALMLLTQGSTKVFKTRTHKRQAESSYIDSSSGNEQAASRTTQHMDARVSSDAILLLLPDPVTPFSSASYSQTQTFHLEDPASSAAVILDWFTSGRMARGEEWDFERYRSTNEVWIQGRRVLRDVMLLESPQDSGSTANSFSQPRSVRERLAPYACYATLFIIIPSDPTTTGTTNPTDSSAISFPVRTYKALAEIVSRLSETYDAIRQMQASSPEDLVWSLSPLNMRAPSLYTDLDRSELRGGFSSGVIIRVAGLTTELVRNWLRGSLRPLDGLIGRDAYKNAFV